MSIKTFKDAEDALREYWPNKRQIHMNALDHIRAFMDFLGNPQDEIKVIHVAGTSGKTSTCYYVAALLRAAGKKVGLTVSPQVDCLNERVQINLVPLPEAEFCAQLEQFLLLVKESGIWLSHFEIMYTFAYWQFVRAKVEYAVVEVGVGGLFDSTNVINRPDKVCVITDIGFDHMHILGHTIREIATHKAGIIQLHNAVFCYKQDPVIVEVIQHAAQQKQADLHLLRPDEARTNLPFLPLFQQRNLGLAAETVDWTLHRDESRHLTREMIARAAQVKIPGRMEVSEHNGKIVVEDVAHNGQKLSALGRSLHERYPDKKIAVVFSVVANREGRAEEAAREITALASHLIITTFGGPQDGPNHSIDPEELVALCKSHGARSIEIIADPEAAVKALLDRPEPIALIAGSFFLLNHTRPVLRR